MHKQIHDFYSTEGIPPEMVQSITFLRQWLNEDRKCDPLVTSRDIWHWLEPGYKEATEAAYQQGKEDADREAAKVVNELV